MRGKIEKIGQKAFKIALNWILNQKNSSVVIRNIWGKISRKKSELFIFFQTTEVKQFIFK